MQIKYEARFEKDLRRIQDSSQLKRIKEIINILKKSDSIFDVPQIKKLKGHGSFYRIKLGNYRIGLEIVDGIIILTRCRTHNGQL